MSIGKGCMYMASSKQKLNTKSSTEAKLVQSTILWSRILWTRQFLAAQGIHLPIMTIYQDHRITLLLS